MPALIPILMLMIAAVMGIGALALGTAAVAADPALAAMVGGAAGLLTTIGVVATKARS
jgi:hypothetical protein